MRKNELICLGLIYTRPNYVYVLHNVIKEYEMDKWVNLSRSSIYNTLSKLVKNQYAELSIEENGNMPNRKVYSITEKGKEKLHKEIVKIIECVDPTENLFYLSVGFFFEFDREEALALLEERKNGFVDRIKVFQKNYEDAKSMGHHHIAIQCKAVVKHSETEMSLIDDLISIYIEHPDYFSKGLKAFYDDIIFANRDNHNVNVD